MPDPADIHFTREVRELEYGTEHFERTVQTVPGMWTAVCSRDDWAESAWDLSDLEQAADRHLATHRRTGGHR